MCGQWRDIRARPGLIEANRNFSAPQVPRSDAPDGIRTAPKGRSKYSKLAVPYTFVQDMAQGCTALLARLVVAGSPWPATPASKSLPGSNRLEHLMAECGQPC
nr:hypothetical protein CFP56_57058 [Quercus suber]